MGVVLLLVLIWAAVLVPPAVVAHRRRQDAFLVSLGAPPTDPARSRGYSPRVQRRRRIAGGLLVAMAATLVVGLLPTFRVFLVVHLFVLDSFLGYIAVLAHQANRAARAAEPRPAPVEQPLPRRVRPAVPRPAVLAG